MTAPDRPDDDRWLTYAEAARLLGTTPEAVRAVARRQKWPRQAANAPGRVVRVLVPSDRVRPVAAIEQPDIGQRTRPVAADGQNADVSGHARDTVRMLGYAVRLLGEQLLRERERADRAEARVRDLEAAAAEPVTRRRSWWPWRRF